MAEFARSTREDKLAIAVAVGAHVALAVALMYQTENRENALPPAERVEVSLATEVSLQSTAPDPSADPVGALSPVLADEPAPTVPDTAQPLPQPVPQPTIQPRVQPDQPRRPAPDKPRPTPAPAASPRPAPSAKPAPRPTSKGGGNLASAMEDFGKGDSRDGDKGTPAAAFGPAESAALNSAVTRQLRPEWSAPSGVDVELLATDVRWELNRDGSLSGTPRCVGQRGETASNKPQMSLHCERAIRAVQLAAPFKLPEQFYDKWKRLQWTFDRKL